MDRLSELERSEWGANLREWRQGLGLTQLEVSEGIKCDNTSVSQIERGLFKSAKNYRKYEEFLKTVQKVPREPSPLVVIPTDEINRRCRALVRSAAATCKSCYHRSTTTCLTCDLADAIPIVQAMEHEVSE